MNSTFHELTLGSQRRFSAIRRKVQFFSTFAGGVIEALRESGYHLSNIEKETPYSAPPPRRGRRASPETIATDSAEHNIELSFEHHHNRQCRVLIVPFRTDLPYLAKGHYTAQLGLEIARFTSDPDVLRQAMNVNSRVRFGSVLGRARLPKLYLDSPPDIRQPASMTFELRGARLVAAMNILTDLSKYRSSGFDLDIKAIQSDFEAYFYGIEKYLWLLMQNFGNSESSEVSALGSSSQSLEGPSSS